MGNPDAINDILYSARFEGAMKDIQWLTEILDSGFAQFITIIAFFIISAALLRNVVAGAYAAYPKFWDMIADAKESLKGQQLNLGGQDVSFLAKIAAFVIPDLKKMSDFDDNTVEPKHYFIKAIPQMVLVVMIGITIYNGYYRDAVAVTSGFGTTIIEKVLLKTDPAAIIDAVFTSAVSPDFSSDGDNTVMGQYTSKIARAANKKIVNLYYDVVDLGNKSIIAEYLEEKVYEFLGGYADYMDLDNYDIKYQVDNVMGKRDLSKLSAANTPTHITQAMQINIKDIGFESLLREGESWYVRVVVRWDKKVAEVKDIGRFNDLTLTLPIKAKKGRGNTGLLSKIEIPPGYWNYFTSSGGAGANYTYYPENGTMVFGTTYNVAFDILDMDVSPILDYIYEGKKHSITKIVFSGSGNPKVSRQSDETVVAEVGSPFKAEE